MDALVADFRARRGLPQAPETGEKFYSETQPRVPAGEPGGGRWAGGDVETPLEPDERIGHSMDYEGLVDLVGHSQADEIERAVERYSDDDFRNINRALWQGRELDDAQQRIVDGLNAYIENVPPYLDEPLYRGTRLSQAEIDGMKPGAVLESPGFFSTSSHKGTAMGFPSATLEVDLAKSSRPLLAFYTVDSHASGRSFGRLTQTTMDEKEVVFKPGSLFRVKSAGFYYEGGTYPKGGMHNPYLVHLEEVVPKGWKP